MDDARQSLQERLIVPKKGPIVPFLGPVTAIMPTISLSDALFSTTQQKVLALLFGEPHRSFYTNEIARWANVGKGSVMRELDRLHKSGILTVTRQGNQNHYQANPECPIFEELSGLVRKTLGIPGQLRNALRPMADQLSQAFIYGSIAKGSEHAGSDIDLMLIGENLSYADVMELLLPLEEQLGRTINPTLYSAVDWADKKNANHSFVVRVEEQPRIDLLNQSGGN